MIMRFRALGLCLSALSGLLCLPAGAPADWADNFDAYALGSIYNQGGWTGWAGDPTKAGTVVNNPFLSPSQSQQVGGVPTDSVHEFSGYDVGQLTFSAMTYIPTSFTGTSWFILLNTYTPYGQCNWSIMVMFDATSDTVSSLNWNMQNDGNSIPIVRGQWVEIRDVIDLTADTQSFYYNNQLIVTKGWRGFDPYNPGVLNLAALDLYNAYDMGGPYPGSAIYYDDMSLVGSGGGPQGACCIGAGACVVVPSQADCYGTWQGPGTDCDPNPCMPMEFGACCHPDGSCTEEWIGMCSGDWLGPGTFCTPNPCPHAGACCFADGSCQVLTAAACQSAGGAYEGDNTGCVPNNCPQLPTGACCFADGSCQVLTAAACQSAGGAYEGDNTGCVPNNCPQLPTGACCFADGSCQVLTAAACQTAGGTYQGDNTTCQPNPCPQPTYAGLHDDFEDGDATSNPAWVFRPGYGIDGGVVPDPIRPGNLVWKGFGAEMAAASMTTTDFSPIPWIGFHSSEEFLLSTTYRYGVQMGVEDTAPRATGFYYWFAHDATWGSTGRLWLMEWDTVGGTWIYHEATCDNSQIPANEWMRASYWHDPNSGLIKGDVRLVSDNSLIIELAFAPQSVFGSDPLASVSVGVQELAWQYIDNVAVTHQMPTGDLNGDGVVDTADVDVLVEVLLGTDADPDHQRRADLNGDGAADGQDIQPFVDALLGG